MVKPGAASLEEAGDGRVRTERRDQLDVGVAHIEQRRVDSLLLDRLPMDERHPQDIPVVRDPLLDVRDGDTHVVDAG